MMHQAADLMGVALLVTGAVAWLLGRLPPRAHGHDTDWGDAVAGAGAAIAGAWTATTFGGPGALVWMWLGLFCWWGIRSWSRAPEAPQTRVLPSSFSILASVFALAAAAAVIAGGVEALTFPGSGSSPGSGSGFGAPLPFGWLAVVLALGVALLTPSTWARAFVGVLPGIALALCAVAVLASGELGIVEATRRSFAAAADWRAGAMGAGAALTAVVVHMGLASAAVGGVASPSGSGGGLRRFLLVSTIAFDVGLAMSFASGSTDSARLDAPEQRAADGRAHMRPLERAHARSYLPSPRGQSVVLPSDTPLQADHQYRVHFRANPRGYKIGLVSSSRNVVATPALNSTAAIDMVMFRDKDPARARLAAWDWRVPVQAQRVTLPSGKIMIELSPVDPNQDLRKLSESMDGPYLALGDPSVEVGVFAASAGAKEIGDHLAMVEILKPQAETGASPEAGELSLDMIVKMGFRGPLLEARPAAPLAFTATATSAEGLELGARRLAELRAPDRGLRVGEIRANGELELPAWEAFTKVRYVAFHPRTQAPLDAAPDASADPAKPAQVDPNAKSFYVPIAAAGAEGQTKLVRGRLRLKAADNAPVDLRKAKTFKNYEGPFVMMPPQAMWLELHSGVNLADPAGTPALERAKAQHAEIDARVWVPLPNAPEQDPDAGATETAPRFSLRPSTSDWIELGMIGPFAQREPLHALGQLGWLGLMCAWLAWAFAFVALWPETPSLRLFAGAVAVVAATSLSVPALMIAGGACALLGALVDVVQRRRA